MKAIKSQKIISIPYKVLDIILLITALGIFSLSIFFSFKFLSFNNNGGNIISASNQSITLSYEKLIAGNTSGNLGQYSITENKNRTLYGTTCIKNEYIYSFKIKNNSLYLTKANIQSPDNDYPLLEGYEISYINIIDNTIFFIGKPANSQNKYSIYSIGNEGENLIELVSSDDDIQSLSTNSNYLYYTIKNDPSIYSVSLDGNSIEKLVSFTQNQLGVYIFGIDKSYIFYINDDYMGKVDFTSGQNYRITDECTSLLQSPMLTDEGIYFYYDLLNTRYMYISTTGGVSSQLFDISQIQEILGTQSTISHINYSSGYLFYVIGSEIYYSEFNQGSLNKLKGLDPIPNSRIYLSKEYCIVDTNSGPKSININWLLSQ